MTNQNKYGMLIARSMGNRISPEEEKELDAWLAESDENMRLFEDLTNDNKSEWAKQWFKEAGVKTGFIKWKKMGGWYTPEWKVQRDYYIICAMVALGMLGVYLLLKYVH
ncbi:MAG: hypothetical protein ABI415_09515 [Flavitalea sp.]